MEVSMSDEVKAILEYLAEGGELSLDVLTLIDQTLAEAKEEV